MRGCDSSAALRHMEEELLLLAQRAGIHEVETYNHFVRYPRELQRGWGLIHPAQISFFQRWSLLTLDLTGGQQKRGAVLPPKHAETAPCLQQVLRTRSAADS